MSDKVAALQRSVADLELRLREAVRERDEARAEVERLRGVQPEVPPRPPDGLDLPRYGLRWNGPTEPVPVPMERGYWTPWHLAEAALRAAAERQREACAAYLWAEYPSIVHAERIRATPLVTEVES
jgi:hypothetical protein